MKAKNVVGILVILLGLYLLSDAQGDRGAEANLSEGWLGVIFFLAGLWLVLTKRNI